MFLIKMIQAEENNLFQPKPKTKYKTKENKQNYLTTSPQNFFIDFIF